MLLRRTIFVATAFASTLALSQSANATEVCGDGIDNDTDGYADNGCYPQGVTGICESPLSCAETGAVAPLTGQLVYREPADLAPKVPFGPSITLQRSFMSKYDPGYNDPADTDFKAPLGYGWHHNFMSWVKLDGVGVGEAMLHFVNGQEILFTKTSTAGGYDIYDAQVGFHFDYLRRNTTTSVWELRTLTGAVYSYGATTPEAMLTTIADSAGNQVTIDYHTQGCYDGQVKRVTDASTHKFLEFVYDTGLGEACMLREVEYYTTDGTTDTLQAGVEYYQVRSDYELTHVLRQDVSASTTEVARYYSYDANHKLTSIDDGNAEDVAKFYYLSADAGKVVRIETGEGVVGYQYGESETNCVGSGSSTTGTCVYFHRKNTTACSADSGGAYCGGATTPGTTTGRLFRATRWLSVSSPNEDLIDSVTSSCATCTDTAAYVWDTGATGEKLELDSVQSSDGVWTSYERNSNGLVIKLIENDADLSADPRETHYLYGNANFPGLVTEVRRLSELKPTGTCTATNATDCKRTILSYTSSGLLDTRQEKGFTLNSAGSIVAYDFTTDWDYDSQGRVTKYKGPRTDTTYDVTDYTYHSSTNVLIDGYLNETKRQKAVSTFITSSRADYDFWGNAIAFADPNGDYTCVTFHEERNLMITSRVAMNGQTSCATTYTNDLTTSFAYDLGKKLTKVTSPLGNCMHSEYDAWGRLSKMKSRDDCNPASAGDNIEYTYISTTGTYASDDGLVVSVAYKDSTGAITFQKEMSYGEARRVAITGNKIGNTDKTITYENDGQVASIADASYGKTEFEHDNLGRIDLIKRYLVSTTTRNWTLTPGEQQDNPTQVADPAAKNIDWVWDDMGRKVKQVTPESGTTLYLHDPAGNLTTRIENYGGGSQKTNTFAYDSLNRIVAAYAPDDVQLSPERERC